MNRKEEIKQAAYSKYCNDSSVTFNLQCDCFSDGAKWADRTMIEKACKWLEQYQANYDLFDAWSGDYVSFKSFIMDFRKAIEE